MARKKKSGRKKGVFEGLSNSALSFVVLTIIIAIGSLILVGFQNVTSNETDAYTIIGRGLTGLLTYSSFFGVIIITIIGVAIFILVLAGLSRFRTGGQGF